jgi:hypothetical protein
MIDDTVEEPSLSPLLFTVVDEPTYYMNDGHPTLVPQVKVLINKEANQPIAVVSRDHRVILTHEVMTVIDSIIRTNLSSDVITNDKLAYNGGMCIREHTFPSTITPITRTVAAMLRITTCFTYSNNVLQVCASYVMDHTAVLVWTTERRLRRQGDKLPPSGIASSIIRPWERRVYDVAWLTKLSTRYVTPHDAVGIIGALHVPQMCAKHLNSSVVVNSSRHGNTLLSLLLTLAKALHDPATGCVVGSADKDNLEANRLRRAVQLMDLTKADVWRKLEGDM